MKGVTPRTSLDLKSRLSSCKDLRYVGYMAGVVESLKCLKLPMLYPLSTLRSLGRVESSRGTQLLSQLRTWKSLSKGSLRLLVTAKLAMTGVRVVRAEP